MNAGDESNEFYKEEPEIEKLPAQYGTGVGGKIAIAGAVATLSAAIPPAAIVIAMVGAGLQHWGEKLDKLNDERTGELIGHAASRSNLLPAEVVERLLKDDSFILLATEALEAARKTRMKEKVKSLGDSLGALVADNALIDSESIWIRILASIERPHVRLLNLFLHGSTVKDGSTYWRPSGPVNVRDAAKALGLEDAVLPLVQDLIRNGLVMSPGISPSSLESGLIPTSEVSADGLNSNFVATWLGANLFKRLGEVSG
ncbi:hypothetical protein PTW37_00910 [Arthrobacter agilis]|uniref:hypothetical protein n=1 Tax=Arthrobacter agilis TaxID=37921 RepID=UPI002366FFDB|nr:hypothetical protein [Arthrobacter agilis]WDF33530.1 hypothetical protein PTW37_00910 [Arthrobacter agilis]